MVSWALVHGPLVSRGTKRGTKRGHPRGFWPTALCFIVGSNAAVIPAAVPVVIPAAHAMAVGLAGLHTAAVASFHAAAGVKLAGVALHAAGPAAAAASTLTAPAALLVNAPAGTRVLTDYMRGNEKSSARAVGRIIQVEVDRLVEAAWFQGSRRPRDVLQRVQERLTERGPIITWALDVWMQEELSRLPFYNQVVQARVPHIWAAVRALEVELTSQLKFGLTTAPLRVLRLVYSTCFVVMLALMRKLPGARGSSRFSALEARLRNAVCEAWPEVVDQLAATLEGNLRTDPSRVVVSRRARARGSEFRARFPLCDKAMAFLPDVTRPPSWVK